VAFNQLRDKAAQSRHFFPGALGYVAMLVLALVAGLMGTVLHSGNVGMGALVTTLVLLLGLKWWGDRRCRPAKGS
jgi:hypothetical protein